MSDSDFSKKALIRRIERKKKYAEDIKSENKGLKQRFLDVFSPFI